MTDNAQTDTDLLEKLKEAGQRMTADEVREQKVSFVMGSLSKDSTITREHIKSELDRLPGQRSE